jgi:hypothetical protein
MSPTASRPARLRAVLALLTLLLLSQWTLAAHACPHYAAGGGAVQAAPADGAAAPSDCDCDDEVSSICVKHCVGEEQATVQPSVASAPPPALTTWRALFEETSTARPALRYDLAQAHAPALILLYCVSLT